MKITHTQYSNDRILNSTVRNAFLIDGHPLFCQGYQNILSKIFNSVNYHHCYNSEDVDNLTITDSRADIAIIDIFTAKPDGFNLLIDLRITYPNLKIIVCADSHDPFLIQWFMSLGASGYIPKNTPIDTMVSAIKNIAIGIKWTPDYYTRNNETPHHIQPINDDLLIDQLTQKELATLKYLVMGMINRDIAEKMGVTESTTKSHVSAIIKKMGVINRTQVFTEYQRIKQRTKIKHTISKIQPQMTVATHA